MGRVHDVTQDHNNVPKRALAKHGATVRLLMKCQVPPHCPKFQALILFFATGTKFTYVSRIVTHDISHSVCSRVDLSRSTSLSYLYFVSGSWFLIQMWLVGNPGLVVVKPWA